MANNTGSVKLFGQWLQTLAQRSWKLKGGILVSIVIAIAIAAWKLKYPPPIPAFVAGAGCVVLILWASFLIWRDERTAKETAQAELEIAKSASAQNRNNLPVILMEFHQKGGLSWMSKAYPPSIRTDRETVFNVNIHPIQEGDVTFSFPEIGSVGTGSVTLNPTVQWTGQKGLLQAAPDVLVNYLYRTCPAEPGRRDLTLEFDYELTGGTRMRTTWVLSLRKHGSELQVLTHKRTLTEMLANPRVYSV